MTKVYLTPIAYNHSKNTEFPTFTMTTPISPTPPSKRNCSRNWPTDSLANLPNLPHRARPRIWFRRPQTKHNLKSPTGNRIPVELFPDQNRIPVESSPTRNRIPFTSDFDLKHKIPYWHQSIVTICPRKKRKPSFPSSVVVAPPSPQHALPSSDDASESGKLLSGNLSDETDSTSLLNIDETTPANAPDYENASESANQSVDMDSASLASLTSIERCVRDTIAKLYPNGNSLDDTLHLQNISSVSTVVKQFLSPKMNVNKTNLSVGDICSTIASAAPTRQFFQLLC